MIVGTAGHIDHGKTSLVHALTGVDTDRLKEEKARGISIELGYAYQEAGGGAMLGFVDVPGHERFVHTMLAGATGIDFALLVVAADDGVMPQTREHIQILELLGIARGAVALTKVDRVEPARADEVRTDVEGLLAATPLAGSPTFPVSSVTGEGVDALRSHLHRQAQACEQRSGSGHFRLAVDRAFSLAGAGTVATGTVFAGRVAVDDEVVVSPAGTRARVRSIHAQNRAAKEGRAGERCALNLAGIPKEALKRGDWIVAPPVHAGAQRIDARLRLLASETKPLKHWASVHVHLGAAHTTGRIALLEGDELLPGANALVQIVLDKPVGAAGGDRFIVRDAAATRTLGGGRVIDPFGPPRHRKTEQRKAVLAALEIGDVSQSVARLLELSLAGLDLATFARTRNLREQEIQLPKEAVAVRREGALIAFATVHWQSWQEKTLAALRDFHRTHREELGAELQRLRRTVAPQLPPVAWAALTDDLVASRRVVRAGPLLHLPEHRLALNSAEQVLAQKIVPMLEEGGFEPPWTRDLASELRVTEQQVRSILMRLVKQGQAWQVVPDLFYPASTLRRLSSIAEGLEREHGGIMAAHFRDRTELGRKRAIQILEFFDRIGYTRRVRDEHRVRGANPFGGAQRAADASSK